jgi:hypothetical protein
MPLDFPKSFTGFFNRCLLVNQAHFLRDAIFCNSITATGSRLLAFFFRCLKYIVFWFMQGIFSGDFLALLNKCFKFVRLPNVNK